MKHKILLAMAIVAIITVSVLIWNSSFEIAKLLHVDYHAIDVCALFIGTISLAPSRALTQRIEEGKV